MWNLLFLHSLTRCVENVCSPFFLLHHSVPAHTRTHCVRDAMCVARGYGKAHTKISWNKNKHNNRTCDQIRSTFSRSLARSPRFNVWVSASFIFLLLLLSFSRHHRCRCRCRLLVATLFLRFLLRGGGGGGVGNRGRRRCNFFFRSCLLLLLPFLLPLLLLLSFGLPQIVLECGRLRSYRSRSRCDTINVSTCFYRGIPQQLVAVIIRLWSFQRWTIVSTRCCFFFFSTWIGIFRQIFAFLRFFGQSEEILKIECDFLRIFQYWWKLDFLFFFFGFRFYFF